MIWVAAAVVVAAVLLAGVDRHLRFRPRRTVIVTCKSGQAWRGVLCGVDRRMVVLRAAEHLDTAETADGEVLIHRADIEFIQRP